MISANNNVRNIQKSVNLMSERYGEKVMFEDKEYYLFPSLDKLKTLSIDDLNSLKLGFRSEYIYNLLNNITASDIDRVDSMSTRDAITYLTSFKGIGLKIASCILLFGYKRFDVFPIDTWVKKYMSDNYGISDIKDIEKYEQEDNTIFRKTISIDKYYWQLITVASNDVLNSGIYITQAVIIGIIIF